MRLGVGDLVVYPPHGIGLVAAREKRGVPGAEREVVVLKLADGLTVRLPLERAREHLRPAASEADMRRVQDTLRVEHVLKSDPWLKRRKDAQAKLAGGDPIELAEIVRDGAQRERTLAGNTAGSQLSLSERELCARARRLLAGEIAMTRGFEPAEADAWIDEQLAATS
jgi:CarD family transcriptional regulator